jgi:mannitol-1-/sugar-/sorbitol-6-phosphatase
MVTVSCSAVLFDLDGVLIDSTPLVKRLWESWGAKHGVDAGPLLASALGQRIIDTMMHLVDKGLFSVEGATEEAAVMETRAEADSDGLVPFPGAGELLEKVQPGAWAVVTGETRRLATTRLNICGLPIPEVLVTADDVAMGKPDPESYLAASRRLGVDARQAVVIEDTPTGIEAGRAAGMRVIAVTTTYPEADLGRADFCIGGVGDIVARVGEAGTVLTF